MLLVDIFCDASIVPNTKWVCGGFLSVNRETMEEHQECIIQSTGTNNSGEVLAIYYAIRYAVDLSRHLPPDTRFRLFSDSKISVYGVKKWLPGWVEGQDEDGVLYSTSGQPVANQQYFIRIFNLIVESGININFYHQRGHVNMKSASSMWKAQHDFQKANNTTFPYLGLDIEEISRRNDYIDNLTRDTLFKVYHNPDCIKDIPYARFELNDPMIWRARTSDIDKFCMAILGKPRGG